MYSTQTRHLPAVLLLVLGEEHPQWPTIRSLLSSCRRDFEIVCELYRAKAAATLVKTTRPDAVVIGAHAASRQTIACIRGLREAYPACKLVVVGDLLAREEHEALSRAEVDAYLVWQRIAPRSVPDALALVLGDDLRVASGAIVAQRVTAPAEQPAPVPLSTQELDVLRALTEGLTRPEIAQATGFSPRTVERTIEQLRERLGVESSIALAVAAVRLGVLS